MPTTSPTAGDVHVNRPLTNFSQKYIQRDETFVGLRGMPNLPVQHQSDLYYIFDKDDFFRDKAEKRADGAESSGGAFDLSTASFTADVYAHHKDVTDRQRANQDPAVNLDRSATQYVTQQLMLRREVRFAATFLAQSIWTTDFTPTTKWDAATGTPLAEIRTGKRTIQLNTGFRPNKAIMGRQCYDTLLDNADILARINGGATVQLPALVLRRRLEELLELDQILVADAIRTTTAKGASTTTRAFIGSTDDMLLYYAPDVASIDEPTAGIQFSWSGAFGNTSAGMRVKRFRMENLAADRVEGEMAFAYVVTAADLGYYIYDVTT